MSAIRGVAKPMLFLAAIVIFILAVQLMKDGALGLVPFFRESFLASTPANSLGFGWLFAYVVMSGSPVAAAALAFFDTGLIDALSAFLMITGSRMGASFVVLFLGFLFVLRGRSRTDSLEMGLLSLAITGSTHIISLAVGLPLLQVRAVQSIRLGLPAGFDASLTDALVQFSLLIQTVLPRWSLFIAGLGLIAISFSLFERCLPSMTIKESQVGHISQLVYRPWVMLALGALLTLLSMSVSITLGILVPLSARGFVRRENVIPYIMGANITTFIDTLLVALLLTEPMAFTIVLVEMFSVAIVSVLILFAAYRPYERGMLAFVGWSTASNRNLALTLGALILIPLLLLL